MLFNLLLVLPDNHVETPSRMTGNARGWGIMQFVATDAAAHRCHTLDLRHRIHLGNLAVTYLTRHTRVKMLSVGIPSPWQCGIHTHPRNWCRGLVVSREFLNTRLVFGNVGMTLHARTGGRVGHQNAGVWVCVTALALQTQCQVSLVTIGNRLNGRGRRHRRIVYILLHGLRLPWPCRFGRQPWSYDNEHPQG